MQTFNVRLSSVKHYFLYRLEIYQPLFIHSIFRRKYTKIDEMASDEEKKNATKRKVILSILNVNTKTGTNLIQLNREYKEMTGEKLADSKEEAAAFVNRMDGVRQERGLYYSCSSNSKHIALMVKHQKDNPKNTPRTRNVSFNHSFQSNRSLVSYSDIDGNNSHSSAAPHGAKIRSRRNTAHFTRAPSPHRRSQSRERPKRRLSTLDGEEPKRSRRSRSRSPNRRSSRWNENNQRRSPSPKRQWSPMKSEPPRRSTSRVRRTPTPPREKKSRSPTNHSNKQRSPDETQPPSMQNGVACSSTSMASASAKEPVVKTQELEQTKLKPKKFKFTVIGDGYIYYMLSDMQDDIRPRMMFCNHELTIVEAYQMLELKKDWLQKKKKKVLISIGASDLRNDKALGEMKRDFTNLFLLCEKYGLKPLITTVFCIDTPRLKGRADIFNKFLMESFENVLDLHVVGMWGLSEAMSTLNQVNIKRKKTLEIGRLQQLILNVEK